MQVTRFGTTTVHAWPQDTPRSLPYFPIITILIYGMAAAGRNYYLKRHCFILEKALLEKSCVKNFLQAIKSFRISYTICWYVHFLFFFDHPPSTENLLSSEIHFRSCDSIASQKIGTLCSASTMKIKKQNAQLISPESHPAFWQIQRPKNSAPRTAVTG